VNLIERIKALPTSTQRLLGLGMVFALVVALPLFIWAIVTQRFLITKKAATGEPGNTIMCAAGMSDNFNSQSLDTAKWTPATQVLQQNGAIAISGLSGEDTSHFLMSNLWLDGDFQAEVDIKQFEASTSAVNSLATAELKAYADDANFFTIRWVKWGETNSQINLYSVVSGQITQGFGVTISSDFTPRLRLVRNGTVLKGYYDVGSGFQALPGISAALYPGPVRPTLFSYKRGPETTLAVFDNFSLGCITTPPGTTPPAGSPTPTGTPIFIAGEPNSCGGTCGSNYNCKANLYCYQGFCRNPNCKTSTDCSCATPTAKPKSTLIPGATATPSSEIVYLSPRPYATPRATFTPFPIETPEEVASDQKKPDLRFLLWIAGGSFLVALILLGINSASKRP